MKNEKMVFDLRVIASGFNLVESPKGTREGLKGVYVKVEDGVLTTCSTDAYKMLETKQSINSSIDIEFLIRPMKLNQLPKDTVQEVVLKYNEYDKLQYFQYKNRAGEVVNIEVMREKYPDYKSVLYSENFKNEAVKRFGFNANYALDLQKAFKDIYRSCEGVALYFNGSYVKLQKEYNGEILEKQADVRPLGCNPEGSKIKTKAILMNIRIREK